MVKYVYSCIYFCLLSFSLSSQVVINEVSNKNSSQIADEDGDYEDWIELYNAGADSIDLNQYLLSDDIDELAKWSLPSVVLSPNNFLFIYASGKNRKPLSAIHHWEMPVNHTENWSYKIPDASTSEDWKNPGFDVSDWDTGLAGIGYGDDDDETLVPDGTVTVYLRTEFELSDTSKIADAVFHCDFDDGIVAYLNGNVIALYGFPGGSPSYDAFSAADHEAQMYAGGSPEQFTIDEATLKSMLINGTNTLAVEVHNLGDWSSDLSCKPFLSFGIKDETIVWGTFLPAWYSAAVSSLNLHTNFSIASEGETIFLCNADTLLLDSISVNSLDIDYSKGSITDGNDTIVFFSTATPGYSNNGSAYFLGSSDVASFALDAGFYSGSQTIEIIPPSASSQIYYTTNGAIPTISDSLYTEPITISSTTVIKARIIDTDSVLAPGKIITNTYFIDEDISVPVISITTNEENLYGWDGIFDNWWEDWKKPCYIEYFDSVHVNAFEQNSGMKVDGGAGGSRYQPQKSMRIEPDNNVYGDGVLHYPIIPRKPYIENYETFYLRNGSNMYNVFPYKDAFMVRTLDGTAAEHMAYAPVVIFLNGAYWGLYELREKLDEGHFEYTQDIEKDNLDLLSLSYWYGSVLRTLSGSDTDFLEMKDYLYNYPTPEDSDFYFIADSLLDLKSFADYLIAETWLANVDWPYNNLKIWRDRAGANKWRYAVIDVELGLGYGAWTSANTNMNGYLIYPQSWIEPSATLLQNPIYHDYFLNRYADLMNSTFLPDRTLAMEDSIYQDAIPELPRQWETWWGADSADMLSIFNYYRDALRYDMEVRSDYVREQIVSDFELNKQVTIELAVSPPEAGKIKISTLTIYDLPWSGIYFDGVPVNITAVANTGFTFDHWDPSAFIDDELNPSFYKNISEDETFTAYFTGDAAEEQIVISEINYHNEPSVNSGNWIELFNAGDAAVNLSAWKIKDANPLHQFIIPDDFILEPGAFWVFADNDSLFANQNPEVENYTSGLGFGLDNTSETIHLFDAQNQSKLSLTYLDSLPWPVGADGEGRTLELKNADADINDAANWFDGCIGGSPGQAYSPCNDSIIISEINYHSSDTSDSEDWIELRNISNTEIDISGWKFMDDTSGAGHEYLIPEETILSAGENYVLAQNDFLFQSIYPDVENFSGPFIFSLDNGGEWIRLYDTNGILKNSIHYFDSEPWQEAADGDGYTLELIDSLGLMNDAANWTIICPQGSPAEYAKDLCTDTILDITSIFNDAPVLFPNPSNANTYLQFSTSSNIEITISASDMHGRLIKNFYSGTLAQGNYQFMLHTELFPTGMYQIKIITGSEKSYLKFLKE